MSRPFDAKATSPVKSAAPYSRFCEVAIQLAVEAGEVIREAFFNPGGGPLANTKDSNDVDLVTATDQAVEKMLFERLRQAFPDYAFIGEETVAGGTSCVLDDTPTVICDPVDGTTNFVHGFPFVCVSLGLVVKKAPVAGVIFNPILRELYVAHRGYGAWLNGARLPLRGGSDPKHTVAASTAPLTLSKCLIVTECGQDRRPQALEPKMTTWKRLLGTSENQGSSVHGFRATGSGALNLCMVARGSADVYWEIGPHSWDMAAGVVLVLEAGGLVVGDEFLSDKTYPSWCASPQTPFDILGRKVLAIRTQDQTLLQEIRTKLVDHHAPRD